MSNEVLALWVAGGVAPYLTQLLRGRLTGLPAMWFSFGVAVAISVVASLLTGGLDLSLSLTEPVTFLTQLGQRAVPVWALSQLVYKHLLADRE